MNSLCQKIVNRGNDDRRNSVQEARRPSVANLISHSNMPIQDTEQDLCTRNDNNNAGGD